MPKKNENQNKSLQSECLVKLALRNFFDFIKYMRALIKENYQ
jgi:hypothetical protein